jgi:phosphoribosylformylglycinamidine (FGAM) synthase-like amidotransferase family enzyme
MKISKTTVRNYEILGLIKNHSNQFICRECAMKVNPERVRYSEEN